MIGEEIRSRHPEQMPSGPKKPAVKPASTVTKVCRIMGEFKNCKSFGVTDLARRTMLLPSDVHRILASLRASGYIDQDPDTRKYRLGFALLRLGLTAFQRNEFRDKAQPVLIRLSQQIGANIHLGVFDERELEVILIDQIETSAESIFRGHLGGAVQLHCTAIGKAVLAGLDRHTATYALERSAMTRNTKRTITDIATLEKQLERVPGQGYAVDRDECIEGASCIGSPFVDDTGAVVGAISASMPTSLFIACDESWVSARVKAAALSLSAALGASGAKVLLPSA
jgi:IclR family KDG regulon transcriptional repressor